MAQLTGKATVYGVKGTLTFTGLASTAAQIMQSAESTEEADITELRDGENQLKGLVVTNRRDTITIEFFPTTTATPGTVADAKGALELPEIPATVTLAGFDEAESNDLNGSWVYLGGGKRAYSAEIVRMTLPLTRFADVAAATLVAPVS